MEELNFELAQSKDRESLAFLRAEAWAKDLSSQEFSERNKILYQHSFGRNRIKTFLLRNRDNEIVSSMDALQVQLFHKQKPLDEIQLRDGFLIASVITPPRFRNRGHANYLLENFLRYQKWNIGVLYSDIGPQYYERLGFKKTTTYVREAGVTSVATIKSIKALNLETWVEKVFLRRKEIFESEPKAQISLAPETLFLDWQVERFRYFSKLRKREAFPNCFFEYESSQGSRYFSLVYNPLTERAEVLWRDPTCLESFSYIEKVVQGWGLKHYLYWSTENKNKLPGRKIHEECPMGWFKGAQGLQSEGFYDPQLCDWW